MSKTTLLSRVASSNLRVASSNLLPYSLSAGASKTQDQLGVCPLAGMMSEQVRSDTAALIDEVKTYGYVL